MPTDYEKWYEHEVNMDSFRPLQGYLDSIPEPKWWQFRTRFVIWWSNLIDDITIWKWNRKKK